MDNLETQAHWAQDKQSYNNKISHHNTETKKMSGNDHVKKKPGVDRRAGECKQILILTIHSPCYSNSPVRLKSYL